MVKVLLLCNRYKEHTVNMAQRIGKKLDALHVQVEMDDGWQKPSDNAVDMIIVLGGDGTMLRAAREYGQSGLPLLGVNMGTLGFLSNIETHQLEDSLEMLIRGDYNLKERMMLEVSIMKKDIPVNRFYGLNEVLFRTLAPRMVELRLTVDDLPLGLYQGDGLIIATPTGSTAYALSAGGPVVDPDLEAFVITPIASNIIHRRPVVAAAAKTLRIFPLSSPEAVICVDGQIKVDYQKDVVVEIRKAPQPLRLVDLTGTPFFANLEKRLTYSEDL